jgi:hypothetical protein
MKEKQIRNKDKIKIQVVDKIIEMYPELKKDRSNILTTILEANKVPENPDEIVVIKFTYKDKTYFRTNFGNIMDESTKIVGYYTQTNNIYKYHLYEEDNKMLDLTQIEQKIKDLKLD